MGSLFKSPPKPKPIIQRVAPPKPIREVASRASEPVQEAAEETVRRLRQGRGRASTIITALRGEIPSGAIGRKALLGGS